MSEKLLIVDDDMDTLRLVGLMLQRQGYQIVAASNGHQALIMAQSEMPDLILLDIMMPDMDGYEVTRRLKANVSTNSIPVIMFTAKSQVDDKVTGFDVGADDYLTKPTQPRELFAHVKAVLSRGSKSRSGAPTPVGEKGHMIGIISAKSGLGASTLALNLGVMLHQRTKKEVIVAEFRPGEGSIALDIGFTKPEGLNRLLQSKPTEIMAGDVDKELMAHTSGVRFLLSTFTPHDAHYVVCSDTFEAIANQLAHLASFILLDLGPGLPPTTEKIISLCDDLIVVVDPLPFTVTRTKALLDDLTERGFGEGRLLITLITRNRTELQLSWTQVREQLGHDLAVAFTPAPELIYQAAKGNIPAVIMQPDSLTTQQFTKLADTITKRVRQEA
jgi:DNA-binding response OmpR family regulator